MLAAFKEAQVKLFVGDASDAASVREADDMLRALLDELQRDTAADADDDVDSAGAGGYRVLTVLNKADLTAAEGGGTDVAGATGRFTGDASQGSHVVSCKTGAGKHWP